MLRSKTCHLNYIRNKELLFIRDTFKGAIRQTAKQEIITVHTLERDLNSERIKNFHKSIRNSPETQRGNDLNRLIAKEDIQKAKK